MSATNTLDSGDPIDSLPTDANNPTNTEIQYLNTIFKKQANNFEKLFNGTKDVLIIGFIFLILSLPQSDDFIKKVIPSSENSQYILLGVKTLIFMVFYFVVKNWYLVRKKN